MYFIERKATLDFDIHGPGEGTYEETGNLISDPTMYGLEVCLKHRKSDAAEPCKAKARVGYRSMKYKAR